MADLLQEISKRRSIRSYTGQPVPQDKLRAILSAGLLAASGKNRKPWQLVLVKDREMLRKLALCRPAGSALLEHCDAAVVVVGDAQLADTWIEDCSIVMANMHLMASSLGVGSCWVQGRVRNAPDGRTTDEAVRELLHIPEPYRLLATLALGMPAQNPEPRELTQADWDKLHRESF